MSGMEVVAVIGCVAAVVSAYKDGAMIVKSIKDRRAAKKALAPTESLETSLERGPLAVGEARDSGIERYGPKFATGDQVATEALRNILIHLQGTLLRHLWSAQEDDNVTDFTILVDASDFGRIQSVTVLNELYMRMAQAAPMQRTLLPERGRVETLDSTSSFNLPWESNERPTQDTARQAVFQSAAQSRPIGSLRERSPPPDYKYPNSLRKKWGIFPTSKSRKSSANIAPISRMTRRDTDGSIFGKITSEPTPSDSPLGIEFGEQGPPAWNPLSRVPAGPSFTAQRRTTDGPTSGPTWKPSPEMVIDEDNPWESEVSISSILTNDMDQGSPPNSKTPQRKFFLPRRQPTNATLVNEKEAPYQESKGKEKDLPPMPQVQSASDLVPLVDGGSAIQDTKGPQWKFPLLPRKRTTSEAAQVADKVTPPQEFDKTPKGSPIISRTQSSPQTTGSGPQNPYGGFCKGAYKLQVGLEKESVKLKNQSTSMTGQSNYWACASSKCAFEGPALNTGLVWTFDDKVRLSDAVQYRWTFLAKSHVALSKVKNREHDYQCVFCDKNDQAPIVYRSEKVFVEHVSTHRGQHPATLTSEKVCCITGRVAMEEENFDVNLMPRDDTPLVHQQTFVNTPDILSGSPAQVTNPEDNGVFQWPAIERLSGTSHWRNNSDASRTLQTLSTSPDVRHYPLLE